MSEKIQEEILGLISKSSFKQCYAKLEQLQKQFPNAVYFKILETYVRFKQSPAKFDYKKLLDEPYGFKGTKITGDTRSLEFLHNFFVELGRYDEALHVYEKGNFKFPSYELSYHWFTKASLEVPASRYSEFVTVKNPLDTEYARQEVAYGKLSLFEKLETAVS